MNDSDAPESESPDDREAELDGLRIRQHTALRRAAYRSRSHAIVAMLVCAVAAVQSAMFLIQQLIGAGWGWHAVVYVCFILAGGYGAYFFARRAIALHREATRSHLDAPTTPPDFSTLGNGSQRWKNLEDL